jgi:hypothetical protein
MIAIPLIAFATELLLVLIVFRLIIAHWPDSFFGRGLAFIVG